MVNILIVEDDDSISLLLNETLSIAGYGCHICADGKTAMDTIKEGTFDLALLDIMLPEIDGYELLAKLNEKHIPVIFVTALQNVADIVKGLRAGAEDYITKPFKPLELLARIEVVLRRANKNSSVLVYGDIVLDTKDHTVTKCGERIKLTNKEFALLEFFIKNINVAITRERLLNQIWGVDFIGETRTVDIHIQTLRKKTGLKDKIVSIPKLGYRLENL